MGKVKKVLFLIVVLCMVCTSAYGKETPSNAYDWRFETTLYGFLASMDVVSTMSGLDAPVELSFGDILDKLDVFAAAGRLEVWKGKWLFVIDGLYNYMGTEASLQPFKRVNLTLDMDMDVRIFDLDLALGYRFWEPSLMEGRGTPALFFDVMAGGRYMYLKQQVDIDATLVTRMPRARRRLIRRLLGGKTITRTITLGGSQDWVEPFIGARAGIRMFEWLSFELRGDIGGFGIGSASDLTWNLYGIFDVKPWEHVSFKLGYRYWNIDYEHGNGFDEFGLTGEIHGPWVGLTVYF